MSDYHFYLIPPFKTKNQKKEMFQEIIRPKCADLLRENGFVSYKNEDLSWYRITGGELLQTVYFYSEFSRMPLVLCICFGCNPLFFEPYIPHPLTVDSKSYRSPSEVIESVYSTFSLKRNMEMRNNRLMLSLPNDGEVEILEKHLLPLLNEVQTEEMAYTRQKERLIKRCLKIGDSVCLRKAGGASFCFAEEAVYIGDEEMYPMCKELAIQQIELPVWCDFDAKMLLHAEQMLEYFETGDRARYMQIMEERKQNTLKLLKKKLNI